MPQPIIGIDLGTTYSLASILQNGVPILLPNGVGEYLTPSAVSIDDDGSVLIGAPARARATICPERTALAFKRDMGTSRSFQLGLHVFSATQLSALVLGSLKRDAEATLGMRIDEAVVTVPAYFGNDQRQATREAGMLAGLRVERIINEPTAAALAYGLQGRGRELRAVVLDLGGGTFDVTVIEIIEGVIEVQSSAGDARLGGEDFDQALVNLIAAGARDRDGVDLTGNRRTAARLRDAAELAKKRLTEQSAVTLALPDAITNRGVRQFEVTVTREEAEKAWEPLLVRLRIPILRALSDANVQSADIDEVLLVGGSSRIPCVVKLVSAIFGRLPQRTLPPDEAIAMGAAVQAALKEGNAAVEDLVVTDVAPFSLGIATLAGAGGHSVSGLFTPILERGTVIPASRVERVFTVANNQTFINLEIFQGEHSLCRDNTPMGTWKISGIPAKPAMEESIDVRFSYDLNGLLEVEATVVSTRKKHSFVVERTKGAMSQSDIEKARRAMEHLKLDPRETLPNKTALARADALFVELTGDDRALMGSAIATFREALRGQEPKRIDAVREALLELLDRFRTVRGQR